ncbi:MFS transporter [Pseudonocardia acaciae]|uniref:MFS transporter n=1 Tax=Pseudonocardia acaciae TaxID=551276 RepID=UPI00056690EA|nr:MFS transporter [Pseudonocardia acaciae]
MGANYDRRWRVLALLSAAFLMAVLDGTILLTALPSIEAGLGVGGAAVQWTVTVYALAFSGLLLFCGRAADVYGRKRAFLVGMAVRVVASLLCGLAPSIEVLVAARALQGASAAIIAPAALSLLMNTFPAGPERNKALGIWGGLGGTGATAGLLLGGVITEGLGWQWVFLVNVPVGLVVLALAPGLLRETRESERARSFDLLGALTVTGALVALVYTIIEVPASGWAADTVAALAGAVLLAAAFAVVEARSAEPLAPPRLLRSRGLLGGNVVILLAGMTVDGMLVTLTEHVQRVLGWSPLRFGLVAAVMTVASVAGGMTAQRAAGAFGTRRVTAVGVALMAGSCLLLTQVSSTGSLAVLLVGQLVFGVGMGAAFVCSQIAALADARERDSGVAAGLVDTSFSIGTGLGLAVATSITAAVARASADAGVEPLLALTHGQRVAFGIAAALATLGLAAALALLPRHRPLARRVAPVHGEDRAGAVAGVQG